MGNKSFERLEHFNYLGIYLTNQNSEMKKLSADCSEGTLAIIWCRIFCLPVCYPKI
jgi:hypothetical protein